jgi:lipoic acid synthetase
VSEPLVQIGNAPIAAGRQPALRLPAWARKGRTHFESLHRLKSGLRELNLHTVCESARCPNIHECFHRGAATFMILGNRCTRGCGFCSVPKGNPERHDMRLDPAEPANVARMAAAMRLRYVVITSVNRDDLADGGSRHFAETVREVRQALPEARVEVLTPGRRPARLQSQYGDRAAAVPQGAPAGGLPAVPGRAGVRAEVRSRGAH